MLKIKYSHMEKSRPDQLEFNYRPNFENELEEFYSAMDKTDNAGGPRAHHLEQWEDRLLEALGSDHPDYESLKQAFAAATAPRGDVSKIYDAIYKIQSKQRKVA